jgi:uncharacterized protein (DUF1778 family)
MTRTPRKKTAKSTKSAFAKRTPRSQAKDARVELRADRENKALIERAAALTGQPLSVFVIAAATSRAREIIREHDALVLSDRDRNLLLELLDKKPGRPSAALLSALQNHRRLVHEG